MALDILFKCLKKEAGANDGVVIPVHSIQRSISFLMTSLCFGEIMEEKMVDKIKNLQPELLEIVGEVETAPVPAADGAGNTRELSEEDIVSFISEFLDASIWPASAALEWIMASLVKHQDIQTKLRKEIRSVVGDNKRQVDQR
ncbi:putative cytochrome P450 [Dioscorea sansibarensis]